MQVLTLSDSHLKGCRNHYGASITFFGFPVSLFHSSHQRVYNELFTETRIRLGDLQPTAPLVQPKPLTNVRESRQKIILIN